MKQITKTVYTYRELLDLNKAGNASSTAVEKAKAWLREGQTDGEWYEYVYDMWKQALAQIGFIDAKISFSGFWSQGDGASFTANIDLEKLVDFLVTEIAPKDCIEGEPEDFRPWIVHQCKGKLTDAKYRRLARIGEHLDESKVERTDNHYSHERTCRVSLTIYRRRCPAVEKLLEEFAKDTEELRLDLSRAIYRCLNDEYDHLTSDETLLETADANDYTFTIGGTREG